MLGGDSERRERPFYFLDSSLRSCSVLRLERMCGVEYDAGDVRNGLDRTEELLRREPQGPEQEGHGVAIPLPFLNLRKNTEDFGYDSKYSGLYRIPGEHMVATDIKAYLRDMTQEQWNEWMAGRLSIAAIVRDYRAMIDLLGYRARILDGIRGHDGDSI